MYVEKKHFRMDNLLSLGGGGEAEVRHLHALGGALKWICRSKIPPNDVTITV